MNAYERLGIEPQLMLDAAILRAAFQDAGKQAHPDAGGNEQEFATLREAHAVLASPSRRLRHWLELQGIDADPRGAVDSQVMDLFGRVGEVSQRAEALIRRRDEARTALGRALLENETQSCREAVEQAINAIDQAITAQCDAFPSYEQAARPDAAAAAITARNLAFLEKWLITLRALFSRLV
jgi:curved DNA-binding protein CbpA